MVPNSDCHAWWRQCDGLGLFFLAWDWSSPLYPGHYGQIHVARYIREHNATLCTTEIALHNVDIPTGQQS